MDDFWEYDLSEIEVLFKAENNKYKSKITNDYNLACNIAYFVAMTISGDGSKIPSLETLYPEVFQANVPDEVDETKQWQMYRDIFMSAAEEHNKARLLKGDNK